ncbi:MAG: Gfo/Idh/MocA family oxidoreductase [Anaerolineales bacterium]|nr:Gfo/Idh/MocA family oxidoreductase [Anaerolineales bacterium]
MKNKLRLGILGTGIIVRGSHLPVLQNHPNVEVVAAGNLHPESLASLAADFNIPNTFTDFSAMAADPEIDAVINALPNYLHAPVSIQMLEAGKHVLCEKPMAMSVEEAEQMIVASEKANQKLMIGHMWRFDREIIWLRNLVNSGELGKIFRVKSHEVLVYDVYGQDPSTSSWFVNPELSGGGVMTDMTVHSIDTLRFVLGDVMPTRVSARVGTYFEDIPVEDTATLMLEFDGEVTALIEAGWYNLYADELQGYTQVFGTRGYASAVPAEVRMHVQGTWSVTRPSFPARKVQEDLGAFRAQIDHFVDCILHDKQPKPGGADGLLVMRVLEAAYRSAETEKTVAI